ncbi:MAG TPA: malto-oligosyltrehalose trehalohydrolase [Magnetospirillaceae bacterium]|jgi:maltooligosyltrehalose trehalohydrolase
MTIDQFRFDIPFGAQIQRDGSVRFRFWAPSEKSVALAIEGSDMPIPMTALSDGWFEVITRDAHAGSLYRYRLDDGFLVPDPASRFQPQDVHGPSEVIDPLAYRWQNANWRGRPWEETVLYETHIGAFSREANYDGVRQRLEYLAHLGITAIELMPLADFAGKRNWGYDGVLPFAPDSAYGTPEQLKQLIDDAHGHGLMIFLDVVYNHFGPSGNYLGRYAKSFFNEKHHTPWGASIGFDGAGKQAVRAFFISNALYWLEEYRFDGLRFDAVHAIVDDTKPHILDDIAHEVRERIGARREVHLVLENDANQARPLERTTEHKPRFYTAQWDDDFHHTAHVIATGETQGYYGDYRQDTIADLCRALTEGFVYQGEPSEHRDGAKRGEASTHLPPTAFVNFLQNHDQIGNRAMGERLGRLISEEAGRAMLALLILSPPIPLLFMGEEWGSKRPFLFFCDFDGELADAVREGRRHEFRHFPKFQDPAAREHIPDPNLETTFSNSRLDWRARFDARGRRRLELTRELIGLRQKWIVPLLSHMHQGGIRENRIGNAIWLRWEAADGRQLHIAANLSSRPSDELEWTLPGERLYASSAAVPIGSPLGVLPPWSVSVTLALPENRS